MQFIYIRLFMDNYAFKNREHFSSLKANFVQYHVTFFLSVRSLLVSRCGIDCGGTSERRFGHGIHAHRSACFTCLRVCCLDSEDPLETMERISGR
jgi:hypothetical protein